MRPVLLLCVSLPLILGGCGENSSSEGLESVGEKPTAPSEEVKPEAPDAETKAEEAVSVSPNFKYEIQGDTVTITGCDKKASGALIIPATIEGKPVTSIGNLAFKSRYSGLTSITIPDSVTSIGSGNFYGCTSLTSITIPNSVTSIEFNAFLRCTNLTSITIPDSVTSIRLGTFVECTSLTAVIFLGDAPKEGKEVFKDSVPTIYRKPEAKGWGDTFAERPVKLISSEALVVLIEREVELAQFDSALSLIDSFLLKYPDDPKVDEIKTLRGRINKFQQLEDFSE